MGQPTLCRAAYKAESGHQVLPPLDLDAPEDLSHISAPRRRPAVTIEDVEDEDENMNEILDLPIDELMEEATNDRPLPSNRPLRLDNKDFANGLYYRNPKGVPDPNAGQPTGEQDRTSFERIRMAQDVKNLDCYYPFISKEEWDIALFFAQNFTQTEMNGMLKMPCVSTLSPCNN
jgi:hypothetical protein